MKFSAKKVRAVVFDLDDTLYPEMQYVKSGFSAVAGQLARPGYDQKVVFELLCSAFETGPRDRVFNSVLPRIGSVDDPQVVAELVGVYRCHRPQLALEEEIRRLLARLGADYKLGLLTDGYLPAQQLKVRSLGLESFFDAIIYTEQLGREFWKPSARSFELMAERLAAPAASCVYVADNLAKDFVGPNRLGWQSIHLDRPDGMHNNDSIPQDGQAQVAVHTIGQLAELIGSP